jgi:hypothetical protein
LDEAQIGSFRAVPGSIGANNQSLCHGVLLHRWP